MNMSLMFFGAQKSGATAAIYFHFVLKAAT
jgi:hypothetical protein